LQLQFGDPLTPTPGLGFSRTRSYGSNATTDTSTITNIISLPAVTYSLNIFNTLAASNDVLARPSLVALAGERSEFFSGVDVVAAAVSGGDGSSVSINKAIGVKLSVTPEFLPDDQVRLEVEAERTFLTTPSSSVVFEFRLDTSKTTVNANVVMKFGETLVLSGLSEEETENTRNSVPLLGDLPMVQYLFARQGDRHFRKSVIILLTPRRAHYVNRAAEDIAAEERELSEFERTVRAFENRNATYFVPRSTITDALGWARNNSMFHEFKTGDFAMEKWQSRKTNEDRLRDAVEFLFF
ncbi:MAG: type II and III secretion system protein, partial [Bauldia sp.]|nr:type II and III secretion system protein [Bauldia sp.]